MSFSRYASACIFLLLVFPYNISGSPVKFPFLFEASSHSSSGSHDYIVVGGGAAGCALAATLSARARVLVLERGGSPYGNPNLTSVQLVGNNFLPNASPDAPLQAFNSTDGVSLARARVLGGGTSVNAGIYTRASPLEIESMDLDPVAVESAYEWVEATIPTLLKPDSYQALVKSALLEAGVTPDNGATFEHLVGTKTTGSLFDRQGRRHPSSDLLQHANFSNIEVLLHATVNRIIFKGKEARGVLFTDSRGFKHIAQLSKKPWSEIVLSAGALGSPQLLMLSGIGPKDHLQAMGIPLLLDLPRVGQGMADNPQATLSVSLSKSLGTSSGQVTLGITQESSYITSFNTPTIGSIFAEVAGPSSRGRLSLQTLNASDNPVVTFNYLKEAIDLERCISGLNTSELMVLSDAFSQYMFENQTLPSGGTVAAPARTNSSDAELKSALGSYCKTRVATAYHFHGGSLKGKVVDSRYRVLGVQGLRVVDGSTFEFSPGTNPCATVMMLGRYVALQIQAQAT